MPRRRGQQGERGREHRLPSWSRPWTLLTCPGRSVRPWPGEEKGRNVSWCFFFVKRKSRPTVWEHKKACLSLRLERVFREKKAGPLFGRTRKSAFRCGLTLNRSRSSVVMTVSMLVPRTCTPCFWMVPACHISTPQFCDRNSSTAVKGGGR